MTTATAPTEPATTPASPALTFRSAAILAGMMLFLGALMFFAKLERTGEADTTFANFQALVHTVQTRDLDPGILPGRFYPSGLMQTIPQEWGCNDHDWCIRTPWYGQVITDVGPTSFSVRFTQVPQLVCRKMVLATAGMPGITGIDIDGIRIDPSASTRGWLAWTACARTSHFMPATLTFHGTRTLVPTTGF